MTAAEVLPLTRDYASEMRAVMDDAIAAAAVSDGSYSPPLVATEIVEHLRVTDPDLLDGWLHAQAADFVRMAIGKIGRSARAAAHRQAPRRAFGAAVKKHQAGDSTALRRYSDIPFPVPNGQKRLGSMTRDDLVYANSTYEQREVQNKFKKILTAKFLQKVTAGTVVDDHYTEEQLAAMFQNFGR